MFLSPWIIGFVAFTAIPMLATLGFSFTNLNLSQEEPLRLIGLENYADLARDSQVWQSLRITLRFAVLWLPVVIVVPLAIALLLNSASIRGAATFRVLFFLPYVVPFVAGVLIWQTMLGETGWINGVLGLLGVDNPPSWLHDTSWIYPGLVIMGLWGIGAGIVVNTAGLQGIPTELYDVAKIDGAGWWAQLRYVTLPMMSPVILPFYFRGAVYSPWHGLLPAYKNSSSRRASDSPLFRRPASVVRNRRTILDGADFDARRRQRADGRFAARAGTADPHFHRAQTRLPSPCWRPSATPAARRTACPCAIRGTRANRRSTRTMTLPIGSAMVTIVLLNVACTCTMPDGDDLLFLLLEGFLLAGFGCCFRHWCFCHMFLYVLPVAFFLFATVPRRGPLRVRALVWVRWPRTGRPRRCRRPR